MSNEAFHNPSNMSSLFDGLADITRDVIAKMCEDMYEADNTRMSNVAFHYQNPSLVDGFNAKDMRAHVLRVLDGRDNGIIPLLIFYGIARGNNVSKIRSTIKGSDAANKFASYVQKLSIKNNASGGKRVITLSRLLSCFPELTITTMKTCGEDLPSPIPYICMKLNLGLGENDDLPCYLRLQAFLSVVPTKPEYFDIDNVLHTSIAIQLMVSEVISKNNVKWRNSNKMEKVEKTVMYSYHAFTSQVLTNEERLKILETLEIIKVNESDAKYSWGFDSSKLGQAALAFLNAHYTAHYLSIFNAIFSQVLKPKEN